MRKGRRERIEKGSREKIEKGNRERETRKRQKGVEIEEDKGLKEKTISHGQVTQGSHKYISRSHSYNFCKSQVQFHDQLFTLFFLLTTTTRIL